MGRVGDNDKKKKIKIKILINIWEYLNKMKINFDLIHAVVNTTQTRGARDTDKT